MSHRALSWKECVLVIGLILLAASIIAFWKAEVFVRQTARVPQNQCMNNLNQIGKAMEMYAQAWGDRRPPLYTRDQRAPKGKAWPDLLIPYLKKMDSQAKADALAKLFRCPDSTGDRLTYSVNPRTMNMPVWR